MFFRLGCPWEASWGGKEGAMKLAEIEEHVKSRGTHFIVRNTIESMRKMDYLDALNDAEQILVWARANYEERKGGA